MALVVSYLWQGSAVVALYLVYLVNTLTTLTLHWSMALLGHWQPTSSSLKIRTLYLLFITENSNKNKPLMYNVLITFWPHRGLFFIYYWKVARLVLAQYVSYWHLQLYILYLLMLLQHLHLVLHPYKW